MGVSFIYYAAEYAYLAYEAYNAYELSQKTIKQSGPRLSDLTVQTSTYGTGIPKVWGAMRVAGSVIWSSGLVEHTTTTTSGGGGKGGGGGKVTQTTYTYTASFAVALCEGEIIGARRIWANGKLIYDISDSSSPEALMASNKSANGITVYTGSTTQTADPTIEAYLGSGNTPAYRNTAYVVFTDLLLTDYGNRLPNITVEVLGNGAAHGAKRTGSYTQSLVYWDDIPSYMTLSNGVISCWTDPAEPRMAFSEGSNFWCAKFTTNGNPISYTPNPVPSKPIYFKYVGSWLGNDVLQRIHGSSQVIIGSTTSEVAVFSPYTGDDVYIHAAVGENMLWIFRKTGSGTIYYEAYSSIDQLYDTGTIASSPFPINVSGAFAIDGLGHLWSCTPYGVYLFKRSGSNYTLVWSTSLAYGTNAVIGDADNGIFAVAYRSNIEVFSRVDTVSLAPPTLSNVVQDICAESGLSSSQIDVSLLSALTVDGYVRTGQMTGRDALQPLMNAYLLDSVETMGKLKFVPRGQVSVATIYEDDLASHLYQGTPPAILDINRTQELDLPKRVEVAYFDPTTDYQQSVQRSIRIGGSSQKVVNVQLPMVLSADGARQIAEVIEYNAWSSRNTFKFSLSNKWSWLDVADVITIIKDSGDSFEIRLTKVTNGAGVIECEGIAEQQAVYVSNNTGADGSSTGQTLGLPGPTEMIILDIPTLRAEDNDAGFYVATYGYLSGWSGAVVSESTNGGMTWSTITMTPSAATVGVTTNVLASGSTTVWDYGSSVNITMVSGLLYSDSESNVLNGSNAVAIGADGRWEIVQFTTATTETNGTITISGLLRGRKGTEWVIGTHQVGDKVVLLDTTLRRVSQSTDVIGISSTYRAVSFGNAFDSGEDTTFADNAVALECYSPVHLSSKDNGDGTFTINWIRRNRLDGNWRNYVDVINSESTEAYRVEVWRSGSQISTVDVTSATATVTAIATDVVKVAQLSSAVGAGYYEEITL